MDGQNPPSTEVATRPDPIVTIDSKLFWEGADRGELIIQQCAQCETLHHPPRPMCPKCHSVTTRGAKMSGEGVVYSWCVPVHPPAFGFAAPPIVALIDLVEGPRVLSNVIGLDPQKMKNGLKVLVEFAPTAGGHQVPVFRAKAR